MKSVTWVEEIFSENFQPAYKFISLFAEKEKILGSSILPLKKFVAKELLY